MADVIETNRDMYGVGSLCGVLPIAPSTFHEHEARRRNRDLLPARAKPDERLRQEIKGVWSGWPN
jgi:hypothetical protein